MHWLRLIRPAGGITAMTNVIAGRLLVGRVGNLDELVALVWVCLASFCLYSAGMVFNDVADRHVDREKRPDRPLPSGAISLTGAVALGLTLSGLALGLAWLAGGFLLIPPVLLVLGLVLLYDFGVKRWGGVGAVVMGGCRFANVVLGASLAETILASDAWVGSWFVVPPHALVLLAYVTVLTWISLQEDRERVHPAAFGGLASVLCLLALVPAWSSGPLALVLGVPLCVSLARPALRVLRERKGALAGLVVKAGVLGMPLLDAGALLGAGAWIAVLVALTLLVCARLVGRRFVVT